MIMDKHPPHENADHDAIGDIRGRVDAVGQQSRAVSGDPNSGLQNCQNGIYHEADMNGKDPLLLSLVNVHWRGGTLVQVGGIKGRP